MKNASEIRKYEYLSRNIIKKPKAVYVERVKAPDLLCVKVISSDNNIGIIALHKQEAEKWTKERVERLGASIVRIL